MPYPRVCWLLRDIRRCLKKKLAYCAANIHPRYIFKLKQTVWADAGLLLACFCSLWLLSGSRLLIWWIAAAKGLCHMHQGQVFRAALSTQGQQTAASSPKTSSASHHTNAFNRFVRQITGHRLPGPAFSPESASVTKTIIYRRRGSRLTRSQRLYGAERRNLSVSRPLGQVKECDSKPVASVACPSSAATAQISADPLVLHC